MAEVTDEIRPTLLMVGRGEAMDAALKVALDRHGLRVLESAGEVRVAVRTLAPDIVLLVGDAAADGGHVMLELLATDAVTNVVPVIVLGSAEKLDGRLSAFRAGAVAVVAKTASADQIATRVAAVAREIAERGEARPDELGEATFDELVTMVASELRSGILSVGRQRPGPGGEPMRIVLGAGRPVADAVEEFVRKLRPLVSRAEPLTYELHASTGGPVGLLDAEPAGRGDLTIFQGLRIILVDTDASRADTLSQELRARGSVVAVADPSARGIERARGLDPQVVIVDAAGIDGTGFEVVRAIRRDVRLRWAAMLVAPWAEIWPENAATPDLAELALRLAPLVTHDRELRVRATEEPKFDARLEVTGPSRLLRVLASLPGPFHIRVQSRKATVEVDVAEGLVVGAKATRAAGDELEGMRALAALLVMASARVTIERRPNPATANVMAPVEEALARASQEAAPIPVSQPPPAMQGSPALARASKRSPFPTASDIGRGLFDDDGDASGPQRPPAGVRTRSNVPMGDTTSRDLRWAESEHGATPLPPSPPLSAAPAPSAQAPAPPATSALVSTPSAASAAAPVPQGLFSASRTTGTGIRSPMQKPLVRPPAAAASAFGERSPLPNVPAVTPPTRGDATVRVHEELIARAPVPTPAASAPPPVAPSVVPPVASAPIVEAHASSKSSSPGTERAAPTGPRAPQRKATLVMGALQGAATRSAPPSRAPIATPGAFLAPRTHTLTMGTPEAGDVRPPPPPPPIPKAPPTIETVSASFEAEQGSNPLFADGQSAMESGEHGSQPPPSGESGSTALGTGEHTAPSGKPFVPDADAVKEPIDAPPVPDSALIAPPSSRARPRSVDRAGPSSKPPSAPPPPDADAAAIGSFAMGAPAPAPALRTTPRLDPTPLGVISMPSAPPPSTTSPATPPPSAASRSVAWILVGLGTLSVLGVGGWAAYARRDQISIMLGLTPPAMAATMLDAGVVIGPVAPDAAVTALVAAIGEPDAGAAAPAEVDAYVAPDAWVDPIDAAVVAPMPEPPDAWVAPPPTGAASVVDLLAQASHLPAAEAEPLYRRVLELDPREHHAALGLAAILMHRHEAAEAVPLLELVVRRRPGRAEYRIDLGDARRDAGDLAGAQEAWRGALTIEPENADAHERLGE